MKHRAPRALAAKLLSEPDPVPLLAEWTRRTPGPALARVLHEVLAALREEPRGVLSQVPLDLTLGDHSTHLDLLLLPSTFAPEEWGMTFLEGLLRKPPAAYRGRRLIEMGTGTGWIALALLRLTELETVLGLDLNPEAVLIARLNAILNDHAPDGVPYGDRLTARFTAVESDLLAEPRRLGRRADLIVGCLPQMLCSATDLSSVEGRYDLSNYTAAQGLAEDPFGLGLNARALRESLHLLEPGGSVVLNLAGRPCPATLERMFRRRGFEPEPLWRARVQQAADTDIRPLADLEARGGGSSDFYLHRYSPRSVPAKVALAAHEANLPIFHDLHVIEGRPRSEALAPLATALEALGLNELWDHADLADTGDFLDEQLRFVTRLAEDFMTDPRAPYPHEAGDLSFRSRVADFLRKFHDLPLGPGEVFAAPNRAELLHALLLGLAEPGDRVVLGGRLPRSIGAALRKAGAEPVWLHDDAAEIAELLPHLRPRLVVLSEVRGAPEAVLAGCEKLDALLVLDESDRFEIGSRGPENPGLRLLAEHLGSGHLAVLIGLEHSRAFPDAELALLLTRDPSLTEGLAAAAELTWSRISSFHQAYYESLFDELLTFQVNGSGPPPVPPAAPGPRLTSAMRSLLGTPALARPAPDADVVRLDYGENELPLPAIVRASVLRGFLSPPCRRPCPPRPSARSAVARYLRATRLPELADEQVTLGYGTLPLLYDALRAVALGLDRPPVVLLPTGSYGMFAPLITATGATVRTLAAAPPDFLAEPDQVERAGHFDVLLLTNPANPSGAGYRPDQLVRLVRLVHAAGARLVLDEVFGLLADLDGPLPLGQDRWAGLNPAERGALLVLSGVSKEFAAGGLRLGFTATADAAWLAEMASVRLAPPPINAQLSAESMFADLPALWPEIETLRASLRHRREILANGLHDLGLHLPDTPRGGLFLYPDLSPVTDDPERFVLGLEQRARVRLNTPSWSGTTTHARTCFALPEPRLTEALRRLHAADLASPSPAH